MKKWIIIVTSLFFHLNIFAAEVNEEWKRLIDLRGQWSFSLGDNPLWADPDFDDSDWNRIFVPSPWEQEGYPGYDGYAWYRKLFDIKQIRSDLYLQLGRVDDVDEVYVNGKMIGLLGGFPPNYNTAYNFYRTYRIPESYLRKDKPNVIAVRVFDAELAGGIVYGKVGIYLKRNHLDYVSSFEGLWKFKTGDSKEWKNKNYNDDNWKNILVPMAWETQGYRDYDGYGWYRIHFKIDEKYKDERLVLSLGRIDDFDEVYLNDKFIGATGFMEDNSSWIEYNDEWLEYREYRLNSNTLNFNGDNVLAVRVFDGLQQGGIYEGPVGIILYDEYYDWRKDKRKKSNLLFELFDYLIPPPPRE